jgi:hypothetical protein
MVTKLDEGAQVIIWKVLDGLIIEMWSCGSLKINCGLMSLLINLFWSKLLGSRQSARWISRQLFLE